MQLIQEEAIEKVKQIQNPALLKTLFGDVPVNQKTIEEMISSDLNEFYEESRREIAVLLLEDVKLGLLLAIEIGFNGNEIDKFIFWLGMFLNFVAQVLGFS